jgi:hypothetical protein
MSLGNVSCARLFCVSLHDALPHHSLKTTEPPGHKLKPEIMSQNKTFLLLSRSVRYFVTAMKV